MRPVRLRPTSARSRPLSRPTGASSLRLSIKTLCVLCVSVAKTSALSLALRQPPWPRWAGHAGNQDV